MTKLTHVLELVEQLPGGPRAAPGRADRAPAAQLQRHHGRRLLAPRRRRRTTPAASSCAELGLGPELLPSLHRQLVVLPLPRRPRRGRARVGRDRARSIATRAGVPRARSSGVTCFFRGHLDEAHALMEAFLADPGRSPRDGRRTTGRCPTTRSRRSARHLVATLWIAATREAALAVAERGLRRAAELQFPFGPFSARYVSGRLAIVRRLEGDHAARAARSAEELLGIGERHGFVLWSLAGSMHASFDRVHLGEPDALDAARRRGRAVARPCSRRGLDAVLARPSSRRRSCTRAARARRSRRSTRRWRVARRAPAATSTRPRRCACAARLRCEGGDPGGLEDLRHAVEKARRQGAAAFAAARVGRARGGARARRAMTDATARVAILGGGIAGLTAAWELSRPELPRPLRGHGLRARLAARRQGREQPRRARPHRGARAARLARLLRQRVPADARGLRGARPRRTDPAARSPTGATRFIPASEVGAADRRRRVGRTGSRASPATSSSRAAGRPAGAAGGGGVRRARAAAARGLRRLGRTSRSRSPAGVVLSAVAAPAARRPAPDDFASAVRQAEIAALIGAGRVAAAAARRPCPPAARSARACSSSSIARASDLLDRLRRDDDARRSWQLADLLIACLRGIVDGRSARQPGDRWRDRPPRLPRVARPPRGAARRRSTRRWSAVMYDLVFAYEDGDPERPRFSAGLGLVPRDKLFFDYKGAIFWKMRAGMGDVVFAPLYQALRARGVRFAFVHRVERLHLDRRTSGGSRRFTLARAPHGRDLDPLVRVTGCPCFPCAGGRAPIGHAVAARRRATTSTPSCSPRALGVAAARSAASCSRTRRAGSAMTRASRRSRRRSLQVWARADERELGWPHAGATVRAATRRRSTPTRR